MIPELESTIKDKCKILVKSKKYGDVYVLVDEDDVEKVSEYTWSISLTNGRMYIKGYISDSLNKVYIHRLITNCPKDKLVDHINHNVLDNRKINLRICNSSENTQNCVKHRDGVTSKYKGVHYCNSIKKYISQIRCNGKRYHVGIFNTEYEAAMAYNKKAIELHKDFAFINEI